MRCPPLRTTLSHSSTCTIIDLLLFVAPPLRSLALPPSGHSTNRHPLGHADHPMKRHKPYTHLPSAPICPPPSLTLLSPFELTPPGHHQRPVSHPDPYLHSNLQLQGIISDLFPGVELVEQDYKDMERAIRDVCAAKNLQPTRYFLTKVRGRRMLVEHLLSSKLTNHPR